MAHPVFAPWTDPDAVPLIRFESVTKRFGEFTAIDNLTIAIYEREFFSLLGPSGCGKTTLMRMLAGFETPTDGAIWLGGENIGDAPPNRRPVNMMFQSYALFPHLTVWDNIAFGLRRESRDKAAIAERVDEMLRLTQLERFAQRKPHQISGGQRQRVALARSLAKAPKLLLLDEPLGALDKKLREETQFELMDIQEKTGTTFVIVTHDQEEAMTVSSRVAVMDHGRIVQVATPDEIYEAPNSVYVADFIGDVNLIKGQASLRPKVKPVDPHPKPKPATAPLTPAHDRAPKPNSMGKWLHDNVLFPFLGKRKEAPVLALPAPEPTPKPTAANPKAPKIPEGGLQINWADGKPPVIATNGAESLAGQNVTLALRPEKVVIAKVKPIAANTMQGKVIDIGYLGNVSTYHVELQDGTMIKAQMANTRRAARRDITWEDDVWVAFSASAGVVLGS